MGEIPPRDQDKENPDNGVVFYPPEEVFQTDTTKAEQKKEEKTNEANDVLEPMPIISQVDTDVHKSSETSKTIENTVEVEHPIIGLKKLLEEKKQIEAEISHNGESPELLVKKREVSEEIIKQGYAYLGRDPEAGKTAVQQRSEKHWQNYVMSFGGETNYLAAEARHLAANQDALDARYDTIISESKKLSESQKNKLRKRGEIGIGKRIILEKEDMAILLDANIDIMNVERGFLGLSEKIKIPGIEDPFDNIDQFNFFIAQKKKDYLKKLAQEIANENKTKNLAPEGPLYQYALNEEIQEVKKAILEKQKSEKEQKIQQKQMQKMEAADKLGPKERMVKLNDMDKSYRRVKRVWTALLSKGKLGVKTEDGRRLNAFENMAEMENLLHKYSEDVIRAAEELTGEKVKKDAMISAGIDPERGPQNEGERLAFREQLTKNVKAIFKEQLKRVNKEMEGSGKKMGRKIKKVFSLTANNIQIIPTLQEENSEPLLPAENLDEIAEGDNSLANELGERPLPDGKEDKQVAGEGENISEEDSFYREIDIVEEMASRIANERLERGDQALSPEKDAEWWHIHDDEFHRIWNERVAANQAQPNIENQAEQAPIVSDAPDTVKPEAVVEKKKTSWWQFWK